ncbi:gliding motility-associated C-terminal domain-containing protein [bacterium SCSIO 12741]|nr:gliding motility-associated C-terminal domain-containing protein [bacterium SCSIO 12741]
MKSVFGCLILLLLLPFSGSATHIVGGGIYYECLGNDQYRITMYVYRDCISGEVDFDRPANLTIYDFNPDILYNLQIYPKQISNIPSDIYDPCFDVPSGVCVEEAIYDTILTLPPIAGGYTLSYQRCCRNRTIKNITTPGDWGSTFTNHIPGIGVVNCNSSPHFKSKPPLAICLGSNFKFDHSATDSDGDSLVYELCEPYHGGGKNLNDNGWNSPKPDSASPPPYSTVTWNTGYNASYPIDANPAFAIDRNTGLLTGTPRSLGQYVFVICVSEYRNGILIGVTRREYQVNVKTCISNTQALFTPPPVCDGLTVTFSNFSTTSGSYAWNFGVLPTIQDTSSQLNPTYTYPDSGTYNVRLIANPGFNCADTLTIPVRVFPKLDPGMMDFPEKCASEADFNFFAAGTYETYTEFDWSFSSSGNPTSSTDENPTGITFAKAGRYPIEVTMKHGPCSASYSQELVIYPHPELGYRINALEGCTPMNLKLLDLSEAWTPVYRRWEVDGKVYTQKEERVVFNEPGTYPVSLTVYTTEGCADTLETINAKVVVKKGPVAGFSVSDTVVSIYNPEIQVWDHSVDATRCRLFYGDEKVQTPCSSSHEFTRPGIFRISQYVENSFGCNDTSSQLIVVENAYSFFIPNSFSPNHDGLNETFRPVVTGWKTFKLSVYDRWGHVIFESDDPTVGWEGTEPNTEKPSPIGTYMYKVQVSDFLDERHFYSGNVYLFR